MNTSLPAIAETFQPQLRSSIVFGPPLLSEGKKVFYVKDTITQWFYCIGEKEYFLISRMDGTRTIQEIEIEYAQTYRRRLSSQSWNQIFALLQKRSLLLGSDDSKALAVLQQKGQKQRDAEKQTWQKQRFLVFSPDQFLAQLCPWLNFAFSPMFAWSTLATTIILEGFVLYNSISLVTEIRNVFASSTIIPIMVVFLLLLVIFSTFHEFAHGATCKYFGGSVPEIGVMLRHFYFTPYCKINDVLLFHNRWHRVYTAAAGVLINLLMLSPFALLWCITYAHGFMHTLSAFVLVLLNINILLNLVPFPGTDGSLMLSYALNRVNLHKDISQFYDQYSATLLQSFARMPFFKHTKGVSMIPETHVQSIPLASQEDNFDASGQSRVVASLTNVHKSFGKVQALCGLSFDIFAGELLALLGPNGSGKTTAISLLLGSRQADKGQVLLFNQDPRRPDVRKQIGSTPQFSYFPPTLKVREILSLVQAHYPTPYTIQEILERFGLVDLANRQAGGLSGGQGRKLSLALALIGRPRVIFLDEPTVGLDIEARHELWREIRAYQESGGTILLTTHYLEEIEALASRVIIMSKGQVIGEGSVEAIKAQIGLKQIRFVADVLPDLPEEVTQIEQENGIYTLFTPDADAVIRHLVRQDINFSNLEVSPANLEDAFLKITREVK